MCNLPNLLFGLVLCHKHAFISHSMEILHMFVSSWLTSLTVHRYTYIYTYVYTTTFGYSSTYFQNWAAFYSSTNTVTHSYVHTLHMYMYCTHHFKGHRLAIVDANLVALLPLIRFGCHQRNAKSTKLENRCKMQYKKSKWNWSASNSTSVSAHYNSAQITTKRLEWNEASEKRKRNDSWRAAASKCNA